MIGYGWNAEIYRLEKSGYMSSMCYATQVEHRIWNIKEVCMLVFTIRFIKMSMFMPVQLQFLS